MDKSAIATVWWMFVCDLRAWGWSFTSGAKDIAKEEIRDWVNHFQWKWDANHAGYFACLLFNLSEKLRGVDPPVKNVLAMRTWLMINVRPLLQVQALDLARCFSGPTHWSQHGIPEPIMVSKCPMHGPELATMNGGCVPDWMPTSLIRPDPTNPAGEAPIQFIGSLLPLQIAN